MQGKWITCKGNAWSITKIAWMNCETMSDIKKPSRLIEGIFKADTFHLRRCIREWWARKWHNLLGNVPIPLQHSFGRYLGIMGKGEGVIFKYTTKSTTSLANEKEEGNMGKDIKLFLKINLKSTT